MDLDGQYISQPEEGIKPLKFHTSSVNANLFQTSGSLTINSHSQYDPTFEWTVMKATGTSSADENSSLASNAFFVNPPVDHAPACPTQPLDPEIDIALPLAQPVIAPQIPSDRQHHQFIMSHRPQSSLSINTNAISGPGTRTMASNGQKFKRKSEFSQPIIRSRTPSDYKFQKSCLNCKNKKLKVIVVVNLYWQF